MSKIIVIGGSGYIGTVLIENLLKKKKKVLCLDNNIYNNKKYLRCFDKNKYFSFKYYDILNYQKIEKYLDKNSSIVLLGGLVGDPITRKYPILSYKINEKSIGSLIEFIKNKNFKKLIFVSTCSNYGLSRSKKLLDENSKLKPLSLYSKSKVQIEKKILNLKNTYFSRTILRFSTAFGMSKRMRFDLTVNEFIQKLYCESFLEVYDHDTFRPYCHTKDFSRAIIKVLNSPKKNINNQVFNVGNSKQNYSKKAIVMKIKKFIKKPVSIKFTNKSKDKRNYRVNFNKIFKILNFKTIYNIEYGIKEILLFLKNNPNKNFNKMGNYKIQNENN